MDSFSGKLAVVTDGGSGMSRELISQLAVAGWRPRHRLGDPERVESFGWFGLHRNVVHHGVTGAVVGPGH
jgi:hypothetical protein